MCVPMYIYGVFQFYVTKIVEITVGSYGISAIFVTQFRRRVNTARPHIIVLIAARLVCIIDGHKFERPDRYITYSIYHSRIKLYYVNAQCKIKKW